MGRWLLLGVLAAGTAIACDRQPATPEARRAKAEELLKTMSASLAAAKALEVDLVQVSNRGRRTGGATVEEQTAQHIAVRRRDGAYFKQTGGAVDNEWWYDGKRITLAMHKDKAWARGPMPPTLDEALDAMATEYAIFVVAADLFYSNPYDSFEASNSTGGWKGQEVIDGVTCHHLAFEADLVDWEIWIADTTRALPCRMKVTYKQEEGSPSTMLTFRNWNLAPTLAADAFTATVDPAYERLYMMRAPTADPVETPPEADATAPMAPPRQ